MGKQNQQPNSRRKRKRTAKGPRDPLENKEKIGHYSSPGEGGRDRGASTAESLVTIKSRLLLILVIGSSSFAFFASGAALYKDKIIRSILMIIESAERQLELKIRAFLSSQIFQLIALTCMSQKGVEVLNNLSLESPQRSKRDLGGTLPQKAVLSDARCVPQRGKAEGGD